MNETLERELSNPKTELEKEIAAFGSWFHNLHLPDGTQTAPGHPLGDFPKIKWEQISPYIPLDLNGSRVLDIGCNAGFYSFEFAKRGALVTGIDPDAHYLKQANWAKEKLNLQNNVNFRQMTVYELNNFPDQFDIVLFMGVFYHLRYPTLALDIVSSLFTDFMIFQTLTMPGEEIYSAPPDIKLEDRDLMNNSGWPKLAFIENSLEGDNTNWWAPNHSCVEALMRASGLEVTHEPAHEFYFCRHMHNFDKNSLMHELRLIRNPSPKSNGEWHG